MVAPERRRRGDLVIVSVLLATTLLAIAAVWYTSDSRGTTSEVAPEPLTETYEEATAKQELIDADSLRELWRIEHSASLPPLTAQGAVVSVVEGTVRGHHPADGNAAWAYSRDSAVCGAATVWNRMVAVYAGRRGCDEVTSLDPTTGQRGPQRTSEADNPIHVSTDGTMFLAFGTTRLEVWRSDMVRTLEFGRVSAPIGRDHQPRSGCEIRDAKLARSRLAVIVQCPDDLGERLIMLASQPETFREPEEFGNALLTRFDSVLGEVPGVSGAHIVTATAQSVAIFVPDTPELVVFDADAGQITRRSLANAPGLNDAPPQALGAIDPGLMDGTTSDPISNVVYWFTGTDVVVLSPRDYQPLWAIPDAVGTPTLMQQSLLVPVEEGIAVVDTTTGTVRRIIDVARDDNVRTIRLATVGAVVIEQRDNMLVGLAAESLEED